MGISGSSSHYMTNFTFHFPWLMNQFLEWAFVFDLGLTTELSFQSKHADST